VRFDTVLVLEQITRLEGFEYLEDDLAFLLGGLATAGQFAFAFAADLHLEVFVEVVLLVVFQRGELGQVLEFGFELCVAGLLHHLEVGTFEVVFDVGLHCFVVVADVRHEVFEEFVGRGTWLRGVHHVEHCLLRPEFGYEVAPSHFVGDVSGEQFVLEEGAEGDAVDSFT
jgi:hypothetical protein